MSTRTWSPLENSVVRAVDYVPGQAPMLASRCPILLSLFSTEELHCAMVWSQPHIDSSNPTRPIAFDPANERLPVFGSTARPVSPAVHGGASCVQVPCSFQEMLSSTPQQGATAHQQGFLGAEAAQRDDTNDLEPEGACDAPCGSIGLPGSTQGARRRRP